MRVVLFGGGVRMASPVETQQAFLEGHALAFDWFGGVFAEVRYDNLGSAVKKVLRGRRRVETDRFVALRSHYLFDSMFTTPGIEGAHQKGGVENEVGRFRRNHLVPVPSVGSFAQLNALMVDACEHDLGRRIDGTAGARSPSSSRSSVRCSGCCPLRLMRRRPPRSGWTAKALVTVRQNRYSVPVALAGLRVTAAIGASEIRILHRDREVACHERLHGKYRTRAVLDHYLELLARKPGGLARSLPLAQERERGQWPERFDELWAALRAKWGQSEADGQMVDVLMLCREHGPASGGAGGPWRVGGRRDRRSRGRGPRPPHQPDRAGGQAGRPGTPAGCA